MILINSNPATIMTDPGTADRTYVGPMTPELVEQIIEKVGQGGNGAGREREEEEGGWGTGDGMCVCVDGCEAAKWAVVGKGGLRQQSSGQGRWRAALQVGA